MEESGKSILRIIFTDYIETAKRGEVFIKFNFRTDLLQFEAQTDLKFNVNILGEDQEFTIHLVAPEVYGASEILKKWIPKLAETDTVWDYHKRETVKEPIFYYRLFINRSKEKLGYIKVVDRLYRDPES